MRSGYGTAAVLVALLLCSIVYCAAAPTAKSAIQAELDGIVAVIPAGGLHNEMAIRASRHWRKVNVAFYQYHSVLLLGHIVTYT